MLINKLLFLTCLLIGSQLILPASAGKQLTAYFQSWSEKWGSKGSDLTMANLPPYVNVVILSFMKPDNSYASGSMALSGSGLDFSSDGSVVKDAIGIAKSNGAKVLVAVGGATYTNWDGLNEAGIAAFVKDFGLDGVDIDYEPANAGCTQNGGTVQCAVDQQFQDIVQRIRQAVPQPAFLSLAGWSIGAYGEGDFQSAQPQGANTGLCVNLLKSDAGKCLDQVNIMSYDAGPTFDPKQAFQAYRSLFGGKLALGLEIPPEAWGGHVLSISEVDTLCDFVNQNGGDGDGMMLWSLNKKPDGGSSPSNPDATMVSQEVCNKLGLSGCDKPLPTALKVGETSDISEVIAALNAEKNVWVEHTFGAKRAEKISEVVADLNSKKNMWLSHSMRGMAIADIASRESKKDKDVSEAIAALNAEKNVWVEHTFGAKRAEKISEVVADLNSKKNMWLSHSMRGKAIADIASRESKRDKDLSELMAAWEEVKNARVEEYLKEEKLYNNLYELLGALEAEKELWLSLYSRGIALAKEYVEGRSAEGLPKVVVDVFSKTDEWTRHSFKRRDYETLSKDIASLKESDEARQDVPEMVVAKDNVGRRSFRSGMSVTEF